MMGAVKKRLAALFLPLLLLVLLAASTANVPQEKQEPSQGQDIVAVALGEVGTTGGREYWDFVFGGGYSDGSSTPWCACFVSWCANECGYIDQGVIPKYASCPMGEQWFKERDLWKGKEYTPKAGDIVFFDWDGDGVTDHTGIVQYAQDGQVVTVEGNTSSESQASGDCVEAKVRSTSFIYGYGTPMYPADAGMTGQGNEEQVYQYLRQRGFSHASACGILANMYAESGVNPMSIQGGGAGPAAGICQWENYNTKSGRWKAMSDHASGNGKEWTDLKSQLEYMVMELKGADPTCAYLMETNYGGLSAFMETDNVQWATIVFETCFERAGIPHMEVRLEKAKEYDIKFR